MKSSVRIIIFLFYTGLLVSCLNSNNMQTEIIRKVKVETVCQADSVELRTYPGIIREAGEVNLAFRVAGSIKKIMVKEGDYVRAGQVIALMDTRDYEVQLAAAKAQYEQVKAEAGRVIELHSRKSVADNNYDKAVSGLKMVEAHLKNATDQLNDTRLTAPVSGYIQKINFLENELIDAGMPVASMIDMGYYQVEVEIPVSLYVNRNEIISFSAVQSSISEEPFPLSLLNYSKKANNNQLYKLQLRINPANHPQLSPGMDVLVEVLMKTNGQSLTCLPLSALFREKGKTYVWVYQPGGTVRKREVVTGKLTGDGRIRILEGLDLEELVVVAGVNSLSENQQVDLLKPASETNVGGLL